MGQQKGGLVILSTNYFFIAGIYFSLFKQMDPYYWFYHYMAGLCCHCDVACNSSSG